MKARLLALLSISLPWSLSAEPMVAANDRVSLEVRVNADNDRRDLPKTTADAVTQHKSLEIAASGKARSNESRTVKWTVYARNLKNNNVRALDSGEIPLRLDAHGIAKLTTKLVTCTYTPEHSVVENNVRARANNRNGNNNNNLPRTKRVDAEGEKYVGYSVQVLDSGRVVGEASDPMGIGKK